jgi:ParB family transcriptional regulator, chromosome partitioning protein
MARKPGLGRGLSALIPDSDNPRDERVPAQEVPIEDVVPNPHQPRMSMDPAKLQELTDSILTYGIIQPLLVAEVPGQDGRPVYQLIAGERRLRAARAAGLISVPVTIRQSTPQELLEIAIVENVQRADLNPLEEAAAYQRLQDEFGLTQQQVAERVGRSRTAIANTIRLAELPADIQASISSGEISEGHGRALLGLKEPAEQREAWQRVVHEGLNVRQTERLVREWHAELADSKAAAHPEPVEGSEVVEGRADPGPAVITEGFQEALQRTLGTKVSLKRSKKGRGALTIHFYSDEELTGILEHILGPETL